MTSSTPSGEARPRNRMTGFSFVEVLIAMVVLMVGLLGLHGMTLMIVNGASIGQKMSVATNLCQERMEAIKSIAYSQVSSGQFPDEDFGDITGYPNYSRTVAVQNNTPNAGMKSVLVTVSWQGDLDGTTKQVSVSTILADRD